MIRRLAGLVVRFRGPIILLNLVLLGVSGYFAKDIEFINTPTIWFLPDDPTRVAYDKLRQTFGDNEFVLIAFDDKKNTVFSNKAIETIDRLTRMFEDAPNVTKVRSLTTFERIHGENDELDVQDAIDEDALPLAENELARARELVLGDDLARGLIVNDDGTTATIVGEVYTGDGGFENKIELIQHLRPLVKAEEERSGYRIFVTGSPAMDFAFMKAMIRDNTTLVPLSFALICVVLFIVFRRVAGVAFPMVVVGISTSAIFGLLVILGWKFNNLTGFLPLILLAVCIASSVHVVVNFYLRLKVIGNRKDAARETFSDLFTPCFLTSFTTAVGFGSLAISKMPPLQQFGTLAAVGVMLAFVVSLSFVPAILSFGRNREPAAAPDPAAHTHYGDAGFRDRTLEILLRIEASVRNRPKRILWVTGGLLAVSVLGMLRLEIETVALEFFRKSNPIRVEVEAVQERMGAVQNIEVVLDAGREDGIKDPEVLREAKALQQHMETIPEVVKTIGLVDFIEQLNRALNNDDPAFEKIPEAADLRAPEVVEKTDEFGEPYWEDAKGNIYWVKPVAATPEDYIAQLLLLYSIQDPKEDLSDIVDYPYRKTRVSARVPFLSSERSVAILNDIRGWAAGNLEHTTAEVTGLSALYGQMAVYVFETMTESFGIALLVITLTIGISLRAPRLALMSMIPNVLPILFSLGLMGLVGIRLDVGTAMIACITIGIAVDDTIHFLARYATAVRNGATQEEAITYVFTHAGRAIVFTSFILMGGFWALIFCSFLPMVYLGLIAGVTIFFALLCDLLVLPALIYVWNPWIRGSKLPGVGPAGTGADEESPPAAAGMA